MTEDLVTYTVDQEARAAVVTLNRPDVRNALSTELIERALEQVRRAEQDTAVRSIVLTGAGHAFAAGADLDELARRDHESETRARSAQRRQLAALLETMDKPTIAAVNGAAVGGGLELAMACTFRIAATGARLALPEVNLGILPGNGGTQRLTRLVGVGHAMRMVLLGEAVDGTRALEIGLVNAAVETSEVLPQALALATRLSGQPPHAMKAAKESVLLAWDVPLDQGISFENKWFAILCGSSEKAEGLRALSEKRSPQFD